MSKHCQMKSTYKRNFSTGTKNLQLENMLVLFSSLLRKTSTAYMHFCTSKLITVLATQHAHYGHATSIGSCKPQPLKDSPPTLSLMFQHLILQPDLRHFAKSSLNSRFNTQKWLWQKLFKIRAQLACTFHKLFVTALSHVPQATKTPMGFSMNEYLRGCTLVGAVS